MKSYSLVILGDSKVGKTSFAIRLTQNIFNQDYKETIGAEYFQKIFIHENQFIKLDIYGTSGNKNYSKLTKYLFKNIRSAILMYDVNDEKTFYNLNNYIQNIKEYSVENPKLYLVGNKTDKFISNEKNEKSDKKDKDKEKEYKIERKKIDEFIRKNDILKSYEISCAKNEKDITDKIIKDITKEILFSGQFYISKTAVDLADASASDKGEKEVELLKKNLKTFVKGTKEKKVSYLRCPKCEQLYIVKIKNCFNDVNVVCKNCGIDDNFPISAIENNIMENQNRIVCYKCQNKKEPKYKLKYCFNCKRYMCESCDKTHEKQLKAKGEAHKSYPYYLMDLYCYNDDKIYIGYCKMCNKSFCSKCFSPHKAHEIIPFEDLVKQLLNEHKENYQNEMKLFQEFKANFEDCINSIRKVFTEYTKIREKELKLKGQLIEQFFSIKYNYQLIETLLNMRYVKDLKYNKNSLWNQKLINIFEVLGLPIEIRKINICDNVSCVTPVKQNFDRIVNSSKSFQNKRYITDICSMNNGKYIGLTFSNGFLELYENLIKDKSAKSNFEIFDAGTSILSVQPSKRNIHNYYFSGQSYIKGIEFYDNYKERRETQQIFDDSKTFSSCLELNNYIIACDLENNIIIYNKNGEVEGNISDCISEEHNKRILSIKEISEDIIYITYNNTEDNSEIISRGSKNLNLSEMGDMTLNFGENFSAEIPATLEVATKIFELDKCTIKRNYNLPNGQEIIGILNNEFVLIKDEEYNSIILFDVKQFKNVQRFYLDLGGIPIYLGILNRRGNLIDFILVDDSLNVFQNIFNEETRTISQILGLKKKGNAPLVNSKTLMNGKIIDNPFKNIVNYISENNFIVINY